MPLPRVRSRRPGRCDDRIRDKAQCPTDRYRAVPMRNSSDAAGGAGPTPGAMSPACPSVRGLCARGDVEVRVASTASGVAVQVANCGGTDPQMAWLQADDWESM